MRPPPSLRLDMQPTPQPWDDDLVERAISGVLEHAEQGDLPAFACTLGLAQDALAQAVRRHCPGWAAPAPIPDAAYQRLLQTTPPLFFALLELLLTHGTPGLNGRHLGPLARAVAAAAFGQRHLWQDLGLRGRQEVSLLMRQYFEPLYVCNDQNIKWKRFVFLRLGQDLGLHDLRPPGCEHCDDSRLCFAL